MAFHPRERRGYGRRQFIRLSAYGTAVAGFGPTLLAACGGDDDGQSTATSGSSAPGSSRAGDSTATSPTESTAEAVETEGGVKLSRPDNPATLPTFDDIEPIADGLTPETGTLKVFNYEEYIAPSVLKKFQRQYDAKVEVTTFTSMDEAIAKLSSGQAEFDVFFPTTDVIAKLAAGKLLQPLNKSYIPNLPNVWESLQDPFYDKGSVYSVPYVMFQTGIGYRRDAVAKAPDAYGNPYDIFWDPANSGQVYLLEDDREVFGMALLRMDPDNDVNTEDEELIAAALEDVMELTDVVNVKVGAEAYTVLPEKRAWVHQCWSGDVVNAQYYLPEGESIENIGYWYPAGGGGVIGSDTIAVMRDAEKPVLAHMFLNFLLDTAVAVENYGWLGYQPPQNSIDPETVVADGYVPAHLSSAVIKPEDFDTGHQLLQLSLAGEKLWDNAWSTFTAGG
jgi:spermidine/putrescine transport system substrate-binding protein